MADKPLDNSERVNLALAADIPNIYFNGFVNAVGAGDILTVLERNGRPVAVLNMSYTVAKTLALALGTTISQFEATTGRSMLTTHDVEKQMMSPDEKKTS